MTHEDYMNQALTLAREAAAHGEVPVGCVIVRDGKIIGRGRNRREEKQAVSSHAEMEAMAQANEVLGSWRLEDCDLYVTLEPCPMCAGAISQARLARLVFGAFDPERGCAGSVYRIPEDPAFPHFCRSDGGLLREECAALLRKSFELTRGLTPRG